MKSRALLLSLIAFVLGTSPARAFGIGFCTTDLIKSPQDLLVTCGRMIESGEDGVRKAVLLVVRGAAYVAFNKGEAAKSDFTNAIKLDPRNAEARARLGALYVSEEAWNDAITQLLGALALAPKDGKLHKNLGVAYRASGNDKAAIRHLDLAIKLNPKYDQAYYERAIIHDSRGRYRSALADINKAIAIDPRDWTFVAVRYHLYAVLGMDKEMAKEFPRLKSLYEKAKGEPFPDEFCPY
jgi:tetratricopeptide (TPR) repeat protein